MGFSRFNPATPVRLLRCQRGLDPPLSGCTCAFQLPAPQVQAEVPGEAGLARLFGARAEQSLLYGLDWAAAVLRAAPLECMSTLSSAPLVHWLRRPLSGALEGC